MDKEEIKKVMTYLANLSHKKSPRTKKYYRDIANKRWSNNKHMPKKSIKKEVYKSPKAKAKHEKAESPAKKKLEAKKGMKS